MTEHPLIAAALAAMPADRTNWLRPDYVRLAKRLAEAGLPTDHIARVCGLPMSQVHSLLRGET